MLKKEKEESVKNSSRINYQKYFKNKKITLMGLGGFSRSLIEAEFLAQNGADLIITDLTNEKDLKKELKKLSKYKNIKYTLGKHDENDFKNRDIVFSANGVPLNNKYIQVAKKHSKILTKTATYVFYILQKEKKDNNLNVRTVGITGTKGKSTTTSLIINLLNEYLTYNKKQKANNVFFGGNIRGTANLNILPKIKDGDYFVAELDSWLLQGFEGLKVSPEISVFTNFFNDHQNYYNSMKKYYNDKSFIFKFQNKEDIIVFTNQAYNNYRKYYKQKVKSKKIISRINNLPKWKYTIFGKHNLSNISQAIEVANYLKIPEKVQKKSFENYKPEEGRFQKLPNKKDIIFYNDNNSTTPKSTIISLKALKKENLNKNIYLIVGGADKNFEEKDYKKLAKTIENNSKFTIFFEGEGTNKLFKYFSKNFLKSNKFKKVLSMKKAFEILKEKKLKKGDIIFLSPAMSSFGIFKNEYERNDLFIEEYNKF